MEYEYINSESYEEVQDIAIFIIEYFKNDCIVIRDFLIKPSPWDSLVLLKINESKMDMIPNTVKQDKDSLDIDDLRKLKALILTEVINNYTFCITIPFLEEFNLTNDDVTIASLDGTIIEKYRRAGKSPDILLFDDFYMIRIIEFYIKTLQIKTNDGMNIDTYNKYKYDVLRLDSMFTKQEELFHHNDIVLHYLETESKNDEMRIQKFDLNIAKKARNYINMNFREENDVFGFINYLFSLVYAYIMYQYEKGEEIEGIEEEIVRAVEGTENLTKLFFLNSSVASQVIEEIHDNINEFGKDYDLRHSIKNKKQLDILRDLDYNFDDKIVEDIMIHTYSLDSKLRKLIFSLLLKNGASKLYEILMDRTSVNDNLYEYLFDLGLDARNSNFYKKLMIKKIVADVFEYLNNNRVKDIDIFNYNRIKGIKSFSELISYFSNNYNYLIDTYIKYDNECIFEHEKSKFSSIRSGDIHQLEHIYFYSMDRYLDIFTSKYSELKYIDDINEIIEKLNKGSWNINISDLNKVIIYVYERLICEPHMLNVPQNFRNKLLFYIESRDDYSYIEHNESFDLLIKCFIALVMNSFGNEDECSVRRKIKNENQIKKLEKMKKYEQID